jgi:dolichyl-phosphate-mannose-protein mannosyltransferase
VDTIGTNARPRRPVLRWHPALSDHGPVWLILLGCVLVWTALPSLLQLAPHGDNVEQLNWSHSYQWGYFKHPPLPTWLLRAAIGLFGPSAVLTYALAMTCVALALWLLWLCARQVLEPRAALVALLFSTANYYLMGRGSFLNHNTVMLPFVALSTWAVLRIVAGAGWSMWLLLGLAQALGLLTKYQMALTVIGNLAALLLTGVHRQPRFGRHLTLAGAVTVLPLVPHALWLSGHDFGTMQNFSHSLLAHLGPAERLRACLGFLGQQIARLAPALFAVLLARWIGRASQSPASLLRSYAGLRSYGGLEEPSIAAQQRSRALRALTVMVLVPIVSIVMLILTIGVAPQNHWGAISTLLIPLLYVCCMRSAVSQRVGAAALATAMSHAVVILWSVGVWKFDPGPPHRFAARALAAMAQSYWSAHERGPIRLVLGPDWEAGSIALYLPGDPPLLPYADPRQAPWIDLDLIPQCGALVIAQTGERLEVQVAPLKVGPATDRTLLKTTDSAGYESSVQAGVIEPVPGSHCP